MDLAFYRQIHPFEGFSGATGGNKKRILILMNNEEGTAQIPFLKKVMRSVEVDFDEDLHFLPVPASMQTQLLSDPHLTHYQVLLSFGLQPSQLKIPFQDKNMGGVIHFEKISCLPSRSLEEIAGDPALKKLLWNGLKELFDIRKS